jgi:hypothetical protein
MNDNTTTNRPTTPKDGSAARKKNKVRRCQLYTDGHVVHHIQAIHSYGRPHRSGRLVDIDGNELTVDFGIDVKRYRNHDPDRLVGIIGIGGEVRDCESYVILRGGGSYCFSISAIDKPWTPCDFEPLRSATPEALAERARTHGGFVVPGAQVLKALEDLDG